ncbi:MAG: hypothetical protein ACOYI4_04915 [Christensenellales bacterium]|jgi:hypothetical protein
MKTTLLFYIVLALLIILPLILLNARKFTIRQPGEKPRANLPRILTIGIASILIALFLGGLYQFTLNYQPMLVAERYSMQLGKLLHGSITLDEFRASTAEDTAYDPEKQGAMEALLDTLPQDVQNLRFQLGNEITPRYYESEPDHFAEVKDRDSNMPVYIIADFEGIDNITGFTLLMRRHTDYHCYVEDLYITSPETLEYAQTTKLMRGENVAEWFTIQ